MKKTIILWVLIGIVFSVAVVGLFSSQNIADVEPAPLRMTVFDFPWDYIASCRLGEYTIIGEITILITENLKDSCTYKVIPHNDGAIQDCNYYYFRDDVKIDCHYPENE